MHAPELNWEHSKREKRNRNLIWTSFSVKLSIRWKGSKCEMNFGEILSLSSKYSYPHPCPPAAVSLCAKSLQLCLTLCDPRDSWLPSSSVRGIFQARILEWVAISSSRGSIWPRGGTWVSYLSCIGQACSSLLVPPEKPWKHASLKCRKLRVIPVCSSSPEPYLGLSCKAIGSTFLRWCTLS